MPPELSISKLRNALLADKCFHLLMQIDSRAIATAGIHSHIGLHDKVPHLRQYPFWLALVYTIPEERCKGFGTLLCLEAERMARLRGINELTLFTHTAESLYQRLGWELKERISFPEREIAVMSKELS